MTKRNSRIKDLFDHLGSAMCSNGLFAIVAESGNFVIWDIEERRINFTQQIKGIFQFLLHTAETMVRENNWKCLIEYFLFLRGYSGLF